MKIDHFIAGLRIELQGQWNITSIIRLLSSPKSGNVDAYATADGKAKCAVSDHSEYLRPTKKA